MHLPPDEEKPADRVGPAYRARKVEPPRRKDVIQPDLPVSSIRVEPGGDSVEAPLTGCCESGFQSVRSHPDIGIHEEEPLPACGLGSEVPSD